MIEGWMVFALFLTSPLLFVVGFLLGVFHVQYLAINGGESRYPKAVQDAVDAYRREYPGIQDIRHPDGE